MVQQYDHERDSPEVDIWRAKVFERDGHKCVLCGATENLHGHHIKPWDNFPELRFEVSNGVTLCRSCHFRLHDNWRTAQIVRWEREGSRERQRSKMQSKVWITDGSQNRRIDSGESIPEGWALGRHASDKLLAGAQKARFARFGRIT